MRVFLMVFFIGFSSSFAQQTEYNTKKGYVANAMMLLLTLTIKQLKAIKKIKQHLIM